MVTVSLISELCYFLSGCVPDRDNVIYKAFADKQLCSALVKDFSLTFRREDIGESDCRFCTHGSTMNLWIAFPLILERVLH